MPPPPGSNPSIEDDLDEYLSIDPPIAPDWDPESDTEPEVLPAADESHAERLLYKAGKLTEEQAKINRLADEQVAKIEAWRADRLGGLTRELSWVRRSLEGFMRNYHRTHPRTKTLKLVHGTLALRAPSRGKVEVVDEQAFIGWARRVGREDLLRVEYHPRKADLAKVDQFGRRAVGQVNDPRSGELVQPYQLTATVEVPVENDTVETQEAVIPGVTYVERVMDRFDLELPTTNTTTNHNEED